MAAQLPQMELYCEIGRVVSGRSEKGAAVAAAEYLQKGSLPPCPLEVKAGANVGHVIPQHVSGTRSFTLSLRVRQPLKKVTLTVTQNGREVLRRKFPKALPAEMIQLTVPAEKLETAGDLEVSVQ